MIRGTPSTGFGFQPQQQSSKMFTKPGGTGAKRPALGEVSNRVKDRNDSSSTTSATAKKRTVSLDELGSSSTPRPIPTRRIASSVSETSIMLPKETREKKLMILEDDDPFLDAPIEIVRDLGRRYIDDEFMDCFRNVDEGLGFLEPEVEEDEPELPDPESIHVDSDFSDYYSTLPSDEDRAFAERILNGDDFCDDKFAQTELEKLIYFDFFEDWEENRV